MGLRSLSAGQFTKRNTHRLIAPAPRPQAPGQEAQPFMARADSFAGPPSLCPAPPPPPPREPRASAYLALRAAGRRSVSLSYSRA